ncbi:hypothetical protein CSQ89_08005 [Chitinimonas sp. BJB300]|nr:hypothetical protein CSQ89_08005 [Chitinimonas sp. BJB300]TSJ91439.1 hypothetical protein FG002_003950 [Chitinimonas sp. BJB300]
MDANATREINHLLDFSARSGCQFVRNGTVYGAKEATDHLRMKLGKVGERVKTADDFIEHIASQSYLSGTPYSVRCPGANEQATKAWLSTELRRLRAAQP